MTDFLDVSDLTPRLAYTVGGTPQTVFTFPFRIFVADDIRVYVDDVLKTRTVHYSVAFIEDTEGGTVTFVAAQSNVTVVLVRDVPTELSIHIPATGQLDVPGINTMFSRFVAMLQQVKDDFVRAIHLPISDAASNLTVPDKATRKNRFLAFDDDGEPIAALDSGSVPISAYMQGVVSSVDATTAKSALGIGTISITEFGAKGDGVTDDADAIRAAIAAVRSQPHGGALYAPAGRYVIGSSIQIPHDTPDMGEFTLFGDGDGTEFLGSLTPPVVMFGVGSLGTGIVSMHFRNFRISPPLGGTVSTAIYCSNAHGASFHEVLIAGGGTQFNSGILLDLSTSVRMTGCVFEGLLGSGVVAVDVMNALTISQCGFFSSNGAAISLQAAGDSFNVNIENNVIETCPTILNAKNIRTLRYVGNYSEQISEAEFVFTTPCSSVTINGNIFSRHNAPHPVIIDNIVGGRFTDNTLLQQAWSWGPNVSDFLVGKNTLLLGSTLAQQPWITTFVPVVSSSAGAFTSVAAACRYFQTGNIVFIEITITVTTNGTAAGAVLCTLPIAPREDKVVTMAGRADAVSGKMLQAARRAGTGINIYTYDGLYPGANGEVLTVSGWYEAA